MCSVNEPAAAPAALPPAGLDADDLLGNVLLSRPDRLWTAVLARPRCEKVTAQHCERFGLPHYLPLRREVRRYQRRNVEFQLPMFHGYLFVQLAGHSDRELLNVCHRVVRVLPVDALQEARLLEELRSLRVFELASRIVPVTVAPELVAGREVRIVSGPFHGVRGIVERRLKSTRVTVNLEMLGQSVSVEADLGDLEMVES